MPAHRAIIDASVAGATLTMNVEGTTAFRAGADVLGVAYGALVIGFKWRPVPGEGVFRELDTAQRLSSATPQHTAPIDSSGQGEVQAEVLTAHATAGTKALLTMSAT